MHTFKPSPTASVVLNLGPDSGVLVIHTGPEHLHREIEISPEADPHHRTHAAVRERLLPHGTRHAALYPDLLPGRYTLWADHHTQAGTVTVTPATVTEHRWSEP